MEEEKTGIRYSGPELCRMTAYQAVGLLKKGEIKPMELLEASLTRIAQIGPKINATVTLCADRARDSVARIASQAKAAGNEPGWLGGLPIGIKDLTPVKDVRTTFGSVGLKDWVPGYSDPLVERLEARGAIIVGKTNTPEMGAGANTFNGIFGFTRNPWNTAKNAGGSSGGAAASLAAGEVWLSHGSDLAGSLRTPAAYCGVVGLRPSPGRAGGGTPDLIFANAAVQGPMARNVLDAALFLDAMAGFDPRQPLSLEPPRRSFQQAVLQAGPKVRIAWAPTLGNFAPVESEIVDVLARALAAAERAGATVEEACPDLPNLYQTYITLRAFAWASGPGRRPPEIQRHFKTTLAENIAVGRSLKVEDIIDAERNRSVLFHNCRIFLERFNVIACPVVGLEPQAVEEEFPRQIAGVRMENYVDWLRFSFLSPVTSLPSISIPAGFTKSGMPVGLQLIGPPRGEAILLSAARAVEAAAGFCGKTPIDPC